jgi:hypothetical protein
MTVSEQRLGKHVLAETNTHVTIDLLWKRGVLYVVRDSEKEPVADCEHSNIKAGQLLVSQEALCFVELIQFLQTARK